MESVEALIDALQDFEGSYILVAHDRYLLEQACNKVWYVMDGKIHVYPGPFAEFSERLGEPWKPKQSSSTSNSTHPTQASRGESKADPTPSYQEQRENKRKWDKAERECRKTEEALSVTEAKKASLLEKMANPAVAQDFEVLQSLQKELRETEQHISALIPLWESQLKQLEQLNANPSNP